ncbi:hypothetical protein [Alcaligenes sp. WGS1538]|uniref:hypothetical protein n=1 Tax=Alcaligenes sp. WGS1538 TaxID=3366811 RepID=UPI00372D45D7
MLNKLDLKYRFGFLIANHKHKVDLSSYDSLCRWNMIECGEALIAHHYETKFSEFQFQNYIVFTLGDIFCAHGGVRLSEILERFSEQDDWDAIDCLSGRFAILIYDKAKNCFEKILTDPIGSRSLFYTTNDTEIVASHSVLLAEILKIRRDEETVEFVKSEDFLTIKTKFLPADLTMYKGIYGMPANHYYSFVQKRIIRFWPRKPIENSDIEKLLSTSKEYLLKQIDYFSSSGVKPIIGLTGGVDCRSIISAWNSKRIRFKCLTWNRNLSEEELKIIEKISSHVSADSYLLDTKKIVDSSSFEALRVYGAINRGNFMGKANLTAQTAEFVDPSDIFVRGLGGEILRGMFNKSSSRDRDLDNFSYAISLYKTNRLKNPSDKFYSFVRKAYQEFFVRINLEEQNLFNYDFGDLVYWEQRMSMWAASLLNEADPALKNIAGLNSRKMYEIAYGLPPEERFRRGLLLKITSVFDTYLSDMSVV